MSRILILMMLSFTSIASALDLKGEWRYHAGDDIRWADPEFDDSSWTVVTLPAPDQRRGTHWLRRSIQVTANVQSPAIAFGTFASDYRVYVNGRLIAHAAQSAEPSLYFSPRAFALPYDSLPAGSRLTIALRVQGSLMLGILGILRDDGPYLLSSVPEAESAVLQQIVNHRLAVTPSLLTSFSQLLVGLLLLLSWLAGARRPEVLWFALFLIGAFAHTLSLISALYMATPVDAALASVLVAYSCLIRAIAILFDARNSWRWIALVTGTALAALATAPRFWGILLVLTIPIPGLTWTLRALLKGGRERRLLAVPVLIILAANFNNFGRIVPGWPIPSYVNVGPFQVFIASTISAFVGVSIALLLVRRASVEGREKDRLSSELQAARSVQQMLLTPLAGRTGCVVDVAYEPAAEVGGDFSVTLPGTDDREFLVVVGDVSGKGLKAAMVVTIAFGILRNEKSTKPGAILAALNDGLAGHTGGGFVTCCCARFNVDGTVTFANAGHPAPYCDGDEIAVTPGLPLGVTRGIDYEESNTRGGQFTFVSDGVVEAANAKGELFGFERTREISTKSAQEIAEAAKAWGQNDDITVVTVRRSGA